MRAARQLEETLRAHLPVYEFHPGYPSTHVTTVYFDTEDHQLYQRARRSYDDNDKVRVKEYYYRAHEGRDAAGNGVRADGGYLTSSLAFVELKQRRRGLVTKKRVPVPKDKLRSFFAGHDVWPAVEWAGEQVGVAGETRAAYDDVRDYLQRHRVVPTSVIHYRRLVYQLTEDLLRVTLDDQIGVFAPSSEWDLASPPPLREESAASSSPSETPAGAPWADALTPAVLGDPVRLYDKVIVEIKCRDGQHPEWLRAALRHQSSRHISKFTTSVGTLVPRGGSALGPEMRQPAPEAGGSQFDVDGHQPS